MRWMDLEGIASRTTSVTTATRLAVIFEKSMYALRIGDGSVWSLRKRQRYAWCFLLVRRGTPRRGLRLQLKRSVRPGGLIREPFKDRILEADPKSLLNEAGDNLCPHKLWAAMMTNEKPGGHSERSVAVGTLDMAIWDATAKIAGKPLFRMLAEQKGREANPRVFVYAPGGYYYPGKDYSALRAEMRGYVDRGYNVVKMKSAVLQSRKISGVSKRF